MGMPRTIRLVERLLFGFMGLLLASGVACRQPASSSSSASTPAAGAAKPTVAVDKAKMADYFKGKTIELFIGYAPGGGYDIRGRLFAEYFSKYVPGNPQVVIQNVAGGGGLQATRQVMRSKPDGLSLVTIPSGLYVNELLGVPQEGFSMDEPMKLGNYETAANQYTVMFARTSVATTWQQVVEG